MPNIKIVFTGCPGSGKTTTIGLLQNYGIDSLPEVPRMIIEQQQKKEKAILPQTNFVQFTQLVLEEMIRQYNRPNKNITIFDRAIPDLIAYLKCRNISPPKNIFIQARKYKYYNKVFIFPPWKEIYENDGIRYETFEEAKAIYNCLLHEYTEYGYEIIKVPKLSNEKRVEFLLKTFMACNLFGHTPLLAKN